MTGEIGIRTALGARPPAALGMVIREGVFLLSLGLVIGTAMAVFLRRLFASLLLFGVNPNDPTPFAPAILLIGIAAALASLISRWRAATADPMAAPRKAL